MENAVLVLNQNYEPLHICNARRALVLVLGGKAEVLQEDTDVHLHSTSHVYALPSVVRMMYLVRRPRPRVKLTRREVFLRDHYTCQYCGRVTHDLTIDHVLPKSRGGKHSWENLAAACKECNHRKGGRTPEEARMRLKRAPYEPHAGAYYAIQRRLTERPRADWEPFIPGAEAIAAAS
jgi:5-methylcytosine-specific restriction endonuclease McrA